MMFSKRLAGIGAVAALVGSALVPSVAFAAGDTTDPLATDAQQLAAASVTVQKAVVDNPSINNDSDKFTITFTATPCSADGCVATGIPVIAAKELTPGAAGTASASGFMPNATDYPGPGVYQWVVKETPTVSPADNQAEITFSQAEYRVKAYIIKNATTGVQEYEAVTIAKDKDDDGTVHDPAVKVTQLDFENIYTTLTNFKVQKKVVNNAGLPEADSYALTVEFTWPTNITSDPGVTATGFTCTPDTTSTPKKTRCEGNIAKDATVEFTNVPVGGNWSVVETYSSDDKFNPSYAAGGSGTVADATAAEAAGANEAVNFETVTNTYDDIPPTGIILAAMPYVLMIGIPLLAIVGYIALRRKMNL